MKPLHFFQKLTLGFTLFSMFFGAGNVIFPLVLGKMVGDQLPLALIGLLITAVGLPFMGVWIVSRLDGNPGPFFNYFGNIRGKTIVAILMLLLGPLGSTPRCIALSYATMKESVGNPSSFVFSFVSCIVLFFLCYRQTRMLSLLSRVLTPLLIASLLFLLIGGFVIAPTGLPVLEMSQGESFWLGLSEGYNTMDLLAAFFFAPLLFVSLESKKGWDAVTTRKFVQKSSIIGIGLLAVFYLGFSALSAKLSPVLKGVENAEILKHISFLVAGKYGALLLNLVVAFACYTTAMALACVFANYLHELFRKKISFAASLAITLSLTCMIASLEFNGIAVFLGPVLQIVYPVVIGMGIVFLIALSRKKVLS